MKPETSVKRNTRNHHTTDLQQKAHAEQQIQVCKKITSISSNGYCCRKKGFKQNTCL